MTGFDFIYGHIDLCECTLLSFVVAYVLLLTQLRCSEDTGDYYEVVVHVDVVIGCMLSAWTVYLIFCFSLLMWWCGLSLLFRKLLMTNSVAPVILHLLVALLRLFVICKTENRVNIRPRGCVTKFILFSVLCLNIFFCTLYILNTFSVLKMHFLSLPSPRGI